MCFFFLFSGLCGAVVNAQDQIIPRPVSVRVEAKGAATPVKLDEGMRIVCKEKDGEFRRQAHLLQQFCHAEPDWLWTGLAVRE